MNIEQTIKETGLPVNTLPMLERLKELLAEHRTNSLLTERAREDPRVQAVLWLIMHQAFPEGIIDLNVLWQELYRSLPDEEG